MIYRQLARMLFAFGCLLAMAVLYAAPAVVVKVAKPVPLEQPAQWPVISAVQQMATSGGESARWTACYDMTNLYLLVRVHDDSPLKNSASPFDPAMMLKGGDAVSFFFGPFDGHGQQQRIMAANLGGKPIVVEYRPTSANKKPYTFASPVSTYVMDYVAALPQARAAFTQTDDGYTAGVAIPWRVLGYQPVDGLEFPFDAQVIFSDPAGTKNIATAWWHSRGNGPACTVDLPTEAHLYPDFWGTARLFAADPGPQPEDEEMQQATTIVDPLGLQPVPITFTLPRACKVSLVITDAQGAIVAEPLRAAAMSSGTHTIYWNGRGYRDMPLPAGAYHWRLGYFNGVRSLYYGSAGNSGRPPFPSADRKGSIGGIHGGPSAVAADAGGIYLLHSGEEGEHGLRKVTESGDVLWTRSLGGYGAGTAITVAGDRAYMIAGYPQFSLVCMDAATGQDMPMGTAGARILLGDPNRGFNGLAVVGGKAYICVSNEDKLVVFDVATGVAEADLPLPRPGRLCRVDATHLLAISGNDVVRIDLTTRVVTPVLTGLTSPAALTCDAAGLIYVAEGGAKQQITQWSADGKALLTYGTPGGRATSVSKYDPLAFRNIVDLALDARGQLWFVEIGWTAPRRIGCITTAGTWVRDYCGPVYCSSGMVINLDDPTSVYYHLKESWIKSRLRFATTHQWRDADWNIESIFYMSQSGSEKAATPDLMIGPSAPSFAQGITFTGANNKRYFWIDAETTYTRGQPGALWVWEQERWVPAGQQPSGGKFWCDRNGDGRVQPEEMSANNAPDGGWRRMDRALTLYGRQGALKPARIDARGVPDYEGGVYTPYSMTPLPGWLAELTGNSEVAVWPAPEEGAVYYLANIGNGQGRAFWDRASENKLLKVKDGKLIWWAGHHDATNVTPGDLTFTYNICGMADGVLVVCDVANQYVAYTTDGLTLGWLLTDERGRPKWSDDSYVSAESFSGQFVKDPANGKYLLFCGASESLQVREVVGVAPKEITRLGGDITLVSSLPRTTPLEGAAKIPYATWECSNGRFNGVDGEDWEWFPRNYDALTIRADKQVVGDVRLRRDAGFLHCFVDVVQPGGFHPAPAGKAAEAYGTTDGVELLLGPLTPADRRAPIAGDTRVLLTAQRDAAGRLTGVALACRPASPPLPPGTELLSMGNEGTLYGKPLADALDFSRGLTPIPGAKVAVIERMDGQGFRLEAEIPLALFPELTTATPVTYKRWTDGGNHYIKERTETRSDFTGPVRFNAAIFTTDKAGTVHRIAWQPDDAPGTDPRIMQPAAWGSANDAVTLSWVAQPGDLGYKLYRAATPDAAAAKLLKTVRQGTITSDQPGTGTWYYWLSRLDALGESQWAGPSSVTTGLRATGAPALHFPGIQSPALLFPHLPDQELFSGRTVVLNFSTSAKRCSAVATPDTAIVSVASLGDEQWRIYLTAPATATPGTRYTISVTTSEPEKPVMATFTASVAPLMLAGVLQQTGGVLTLDTSVPATELTLPATRLTWNGQGSLPVDAIGTHGYVLFRHGGYSAAQPYRRILAPFVDTFTAGDGFWYGDDTENMRFDLRKDKDTVVPGRDAGGHVRFGSVNSNSGTPGQPNTYPGVSWNISVTDAAPHLLTVFTPSKGVGAKERLQLRDADGKATPVTVEFDGSQGGAVVQFRFVGNVVLTIQQTVGGMGSSAPGANCAALFFD